MVKILLKVYGGTRTAIISLPVEEALKLLAIEGVKIDWIMHRLREKMLL